MYQLDGTNLSNDYLVELYRDVTQELIEELPDFVGTKLIISDSRYSLLLYTYVKDFVSC